MTQMELAYKAEELKRLKTKVDTLTKDIAAIEDELKAEMAARETDELTAGIFKLRFRKVKTNRFNTSAFKSKYAELYQQFTTPVESKRFTIA